MISVLGIQTITKRTNENGIEEITIRREGSITNFIPPVIVICEDKLTEHILKSIDGINSGSLKIIRAGSWNNFTSLLYGINLYKKSMGPLGLLEVICVIDGDINQKNISKRIKKTHIGRITDNNKDMEEILNTVKLGLINFKLEYVNPEITGLPEFNHSKWLEEISKDELYKFFQNRIDELEMIKNQKSEHSPIIDIEIFSIRKKIEETLRIIEASKLVSNRSYSKENKITMKKNKKYKNGILLQQSNPSRINYHSYYKNLAQELNKGDSFMEYRINKKFGNEIIDIEEVEYAIFSIIKQFNPIKWEKYVSEVKNKLELSIKKHSEIFRIDYLNNEKI